MKEKTNKLAQFIEIAGKQQRPQLLCLWVKRCYENGKTVLIRVDSEKAAGYVDGLLWTFEDAGFLPHAVAVAESGVEPAVDPILICAGQERLPIMQVLVEASGGEPCGCFEKFDHIIDFAYLYDEHLKSMSRRRFGAYQSAGYSMRLIKGVEKN